MLRIPIKYRPPGRTPNLVSYVLEGEADDRLLDVMNRRLGTAPLAYVLTMRLEGNGTAAVLVDAEDRFGDLAQLREGDSDELIFRQGGFGGDGVLIVIKSLFELIGGLQTVEGAASSVQGRVSAFAYRNHRSEALTWLRRGKDSKISGALADLISARPEWQEPAFEKVFGLSKGDSLDLLRAAGYTHILDATWRTSYSI